MTKFVFVFPGQGSQAIAMLDGFAGNPGVAETIAEASAALGFDLGKLIAEGAATEVMKNSEVVGAYLGTGLA